MALTDTHVLGAFPASREVDRELYYLVTIVGIALWSFPAPPEVDSELYRTTSIKLILGMGSRPLAR